jgi:tRNA-modifying protein YgfZ
MNAPFRLDDRAVLTVLGDDAVAFLQGLLTNDVASAQEGEARFAALLSPQGKILADMIAVRRADGFWLDVPKALASDLAKRLGFYKLRAKVAIADVSDAYSVTALGAPPHAAAVYADPRAAGLGERAIVARADSASPRSDRTAYDSLRIALGVPEGGVDFAYGDSFPHDVNMDLLHGVDFAKGCYVGQEIVARMQHKGGVRKRTVRLRFEGAAPAPGTPVMDGDVTLGALGGAHGEEALATLRIDKLDDAKAAGRALSADGTPLRPA